MGAGAPEAQLLRFFRIQAERGKLRSGRKVDEDEDKGLPIPDCLDWRIERVLLHERNRSSRHEVTTLWSLEDLARANLALDLQEEAERRAHAKAKHDAEMARIQRELNR